MSTTIVTGGAGFIGSHVVEALLKKPGERVVVIDDFNDYYDPAIKRQNLDAVKDHPSLVLVEADIRDEGKMREIFQKEKPDRMVHLAARAGVRPSLSQRDLYFAVNVDGTMNVLRAAHAAGVKHAVIASSSSVYGERQDGKPFLEDDVLGEPKSPYAGSKQEMERQAAVFQKETEMSIVALRFFTVYGPRQRPDMAIATFVRVIDRGLPLPLYGDGSARRDFTYIEDIVDGVLAAVDRPYKDGWRVYNLGESHTTTVREIITLIESALGKKAVIDNHPQQTGDMPVTFADVSRSRSELGYNPKILPEQGIRKYVEWYKATVPLRAK